jgi:nucleoside-diphosphate-sugar epimerase
VFLEELGCQVSVHVRSEDGDISDSAIPDADVVVNAAGRLGSREADPDELIRANASLPAILADHCSRTGAHLIHISTPGVTGLRADASEDDDYDPRGDYEKSKAEGELALLGHPSLPGDRLTIIRPDFVYGPGDLHKLPLFRRVARELMPVVGIHGARIRPTYCDDVCRAVEAALPGGVLNGGLFNIGGPETVTVRELSGMIAAAACRKTMVLPVPRILFRLALHMGPLCPGTLSESRLRLFGEDHFVSIAKASEAGFSPVWTLRDGLHETVDWYLGNGLIG